MEKCVLVVSRAYVKEACGTEHICGSTEVGIARGIHATQMLCKHHSQEEDWVLLLICTWNDFNEKNRTAML